ncbi:MAG: hypothetical protein IPL08_08025 [Saprospiraceae bacterium]|jgi:hypothetical protein|nr:hypothetical protein [Saprospiraceae bacterium]MBK8668283.1 hypothetical protein [Saprospiraceae bacterium]MBL0099236.1 hypothetical protein [Saprospiraceae bacterium]
MIRLLLFTILSATVLSSCYDIDEAILPVVGIYRAHVVGVAGPFDLIISTNGGDNVIIEAPFDGIDWYTVKADIDNQHERTMDIRVGNQEIAPFTKMKGTGFFRDGTIELRYSINFDGEWIDFKLVGTKI